MELIVSREQWEQLMTYLSQEVEHFAFMFARINSQGKYRVIEVKLLESDDYSYQGRAGLQLVDEIRPEVIQHAIATDTMVIEAHSHYGLPWPACFSDLDMTGLAEIAPHMLWRLKGRPYAAIVVANGSFDAIVWLDRNGPSRVEHVHVADKVIQPTNLTIEGISND
jgi:hypothetical protein